MSRMIARIVNESAEPLETTEVHLKVQHAAAELGIKGLERPALLYRLANLRADGAIKGKQIGSGMGSWIWWGKSFRR